MPSTSMGWHRMQYAQVSYVHESISHGDVTEVAANASNRLNQLKLKATYSYQAKYGASLGYFSTTGTSDAVLYPDAASNPDTRGWVPELYLDSRTAPARRHPVLRV